MFLAVTTDEHSQSQATSIRFCVNMESQIKYLLSLRAIRDRANVVAEVAKAGNLSHFELREDKLDDAVDFVALVIKVWRLRDPYGV